MSWLPLYFWQHQFTDCMSEWCMILWRLKVYFEFEGQPGLYSMTLSQKTLPKNKPLHSWLTDKKKLVQVPSWIFRNYVQILGSTSFKTFLFLFWGRVWAWHSNPRNLLDRQVWPWNSYPHLYPDDAVLDMSHIMVWVNTWPGNSDGLRRWKRVPGRGSAMRHSHSIAVWFTVERIYHLHS